MYRVRRKKARNRPTKAPFFEETNIRKLASFDWKFSITTVGLKYGRNAKYVISPGVISTRDALI